MVRAHHLADQAQSLERLPRLSCRVEGESSVDEGLDRLPSEEIEPGDRVVPNAACTS